MRQLYLVNEVGTTYFFDMRSNTLINGISDLGFQKELDYLTFEDTSVVVKEKNVLGEVQLGLVFLEGYQGYTNFIDFKKKSKGRMRLFYKIKDDIKFIYVAIKQLTKTELQSGVLQCTLIMDKLSLWLKRASMVIDVRAGTEGKIFPYSYPYKYTASYNGEADITNNGEYKAALKIYIKGGVSNPSIELIKDGEVVSKMRLIVEANDCEIEVNADVSDQYMKIKVDGLESNIYQLQDFTCDNFLFVEPGTYTLRFNPGTNVEGTFARVSYIEGYSGH